MYKHYTYSIIGIILFLLILRCSVTNPPQENEISLLDINATSLVKLITTDAVYALQRKSVDSYDDGHFKKTKELSNLALTLASKYIVEKDTIYTVALYNSAIILDIQGAAEEAIATYIKVKQIEDSLNLSPNSFSLTYNAIGVSYRQLGDYHNALNYLDYAIKLRIDSAKIKDDITATFISDKALCLERLGQIEAAKIANKQCLGIIDTLSNKDSTFVQQIALYAYQNLAAMQLAEIDEQIKIIDRDHLKKLQTTAKKYLNTSEEIIKKYQPSQKCYYTYELLGKIKLQQKEYKAARVYYNKAIEQRKKEMEGASKDIEIARLYNMEAIAYRMEGKLDKALKCHQKAVNVISINTVSKYINKTYAIEILSEYAVSLKENQQIKQAFEIYQDLAELIPETRRSYKEEGSKYQLSRATIPIYEAAIELALVLYKTTKDDYYKAQAFYFSERNKAVQLLEDMQYRYAQQESSDLPDSLRIKEEKLRFEMNSLERQIVGFQAKNNLEKAAQQKVKKLESQLFKIKQKYNNELQDQLKAYPNYWALRYDVPLDSITAIQSTLDTNTALLAFFVGKQTIVQYFVSHNDFKIHSIPRTNQFDQAIKTIKKIIKEKDNNRYPDFSKASYFVYEHLLKNTLEANPAIERLICIPDGPFHDIPIDILLTAQEEDAYLLKKYAISSLYSFNLLNYHIEQKKDKQRYIYTGIAPILNEKHEQLLLPKIAAEINESANLLESKGATRSYANSDNSLLKRMINLFYSSGNYEAENIGITDIEQAALDSKILHLATHAEKDTTYIKLNKIYLSDTVMTNYDLDQMTFNTDLVVLNACGTGSGKIIDGEGAMSLARSIIRSGSPRVLASSWNISDNTAKEIILEFYENAIDGQPLDKALQVAKISYLETQKNHKSYPFYWGAFQLYGCKDAIFSEK